MGKNKNLIIIASIGIILFLAGGGLYFVSQNSDKEGKTNDKAAMEISTNPNYLEYSKINLDSTKDSKRVLFFYASWCPICRPVDTALKNNTTKIPDGVKIVRVNFNDPDTDQEEKDLAKKYNVTYQHTFVQIDENGNELNKWSAEDINTVFDNLN